MERKGTGGEERKEADGSAAEDKENVDPRPGTLAGRKKVKSVAVCGAETGADRPVLQATMANRTVWVTLVLCS